MKRQFLAIPLALTSALASVPLAFGLEPAPHRFAAVPVRAEGADAQVIQVLNRLTLGAAPGDFERVKAMGVRAYIQAQLQPQNIAESPVVNDQERRAAIIHQKSSDLIREFRQVLQQNKAAKQEKLGQNQIAPVEGQGQTGAELPDKNKGQANGPKREFFKNANDELVQTRLVRALYSPKQLQEVMVDFWFNHFNVSVNKGMDRLLIGPYEEQAIRPNVFGKFRDILGATCYHPAMLFYLDNWQNAADGVAGPKGKKSGLNENYARELMELHTLGVDGGYTQKDVIELARVLTGLSLPNPGMRGQGGRAGGRAGAGAGAGEAVANGYWGQFYPNRHDSGEKVVLGHRITTSGAGEIEEALDMLARHPSTAKHISYELAQYFVADDPPQALVDRLAKRFTETDGDTRAVLTTLFESPEFFDYKYQNNKYKSPFRYAISALRATGVQPQRYEQVAGFLRQQGQPLYGCLTPDGYKNTKAAWLNSDALLKRINFATAVGGGAERGLGQTVDFEQIIDTVNGGKLNFKTNEVIAKTPAPLKAAILLGSPDFMNY